VILGLALALACAAAPSVSFLLKHRGAVSAPPVRPRHPLRSAAGLFRSRWFAIGWALAVVAWLLHVGALALTPLSIVQAVLSGGLVFLAVFAERFFGFQLGRRQWIGVIVTAIGLAIIGLTSGSGAAEPREYALAALISIECGVLVVGIAVAVFSSHHRVPPAAEGLMLAAAAGALFGVSDVAIKFLADDVGGVLGLISPWTLAAGCGAPRRAGLAGLSPGDRVRRRPSVVAGQRLTRTASRMKAFVVGASLWRLAMKARTVLPVRRSTAVTAPCW
jgi:drug/metabolite transporter (DMT)-like permease